MTEAVDVLARLHTAAVDASNGYQEALEDADGQGLTPLFSQMITLHDAHAADLASELAALGALPDEGGSLMSVVNRTIMNVRGLFGGLEESVLPGVIDGEERNLAAYDDALSELGLTPDHRTLLLHHRERLSARIEEMRADAR